MNKKIISAFVFLAASGSLLAAELYEGKWAARTTWCKNNAEVTDSVPIIITRNRIEGLESGCTFSSVKKGPKDWLASAKCSGEGETWRESIRLSTTGDVLILSRNGGQAIKYKRCRSK